VGLENLEIGLAIGLAYAEYFERVGELHAAYERVPVADLDIGWLEVAAPAERAFETHLEAARPGRGAWGSRVRERLDHIKLRGKWKKAARQLRESGQACAP